MRKKLLPIFALIVSLLIPSTTSKATDIPGEQFTVSKPSTNDRYTGINFAFGEDDKNTASYLEALTADGTSRESRVTSKFNCSKLGDSNCDASKYFRYSALLEPCSSVIKIDCVFKVFATKSDKTVIEGRFVESYPGRTPYSYEGDSSINLPSSGSSFVVDFPGLPHQGGSNYLVIANMTGYKGFGESKFKLENFSTSIYAVSKQSGRFSVSIPEPRIRFDHTVGGRAINQGGWFADGARTGRAACVQSAGDSCMYSWPLPMDVEFGLTLNLNTKITGWLHGRLSDVSAEIANSENGLQVVTLRGKPVIIPGLYGWFKKSDLPEVLKSLYLRDNRIDTEGAGWPANDGTPDGPDGLPYSIIKTGFGYDSGGLTQILAWSEALNDKAAYTTSVWSFRSIRSESDYSNCFKGQENLSGIVSTNALMYIAGPPTFNNAEKSLDYQVAAPHYLPDGMEFRGVYNLLIQSDVARCIYGFTKAPVSATISIVSADGANKVATTSFTENRGWMNLSASNFTFSTPTLKVKLTQVAVSDPKEVLAKQETSQSQNRTQTSQIAEPKPALVKTRSIKCVRGKTTKKISGVNPKCPTGFKKK